MPRRDTLQGLGTGAGNIIGTILSILAQQRANQNFQDFLRRTESVTPTMGDPASINIGGIQTSVPRFTGTQTTPDWNARIQGAATDPMLMQRLLPLLQMQGMVQPKYQFINQERGGLQQVSIPPFGGQPTVKQVVDPMPERQDGFTLSPGQVRYSSGGNPMAAGLPQEMDTPTTPAGWLEASTNPKYSLEERRRFRSLYDQYQRDQINLAGGKAGAVAGTRQPTKEQVDAVAESNSFLKDLDEMELVAINKPEFVGWLDDLIGGAREKFGGISPEEARFRPTVASLKNRILKIRSGVAINPTEFARILEELPTTGISETAFLERVRKTRENIKYMLQLYEQQTGRRADFQNDATPVSPRSTGAPTSRFQILKVE